MPFKAQKGKIMNNEPKKNVDHDEIVEVNARKLECMIWLGMLIAAILILVAFLVGLLFGQRYAG